MTGFLARYPDGAPGIALVLLRLSCAWIAILASLPFRQLSPHAAMVVSAALALALGLGCGTRIVAFVLAVVAIATTFMAGSDIAVTMIARACACAALGVLGPGAYSIDANVFGRRVFRLEPRASDRAIDD